MAGIVTSIFGEPDEFQEALREDGVANLLVVDSGQFRARLTQIALQRSHLLACDEQLRRIAFVSVPADMVFVTFSMSNRRPAPLWSGVEMRTSEIIMLGSGMIRQHDHAAIKRAVRAGIIDAETEQ
jgi:hypothetical protein